MADGLADGLAEALADGLADAVADGLADGLADAVADGLADGLADAVADGLAEGLADTVTDGLVDGVADGVGDCVVVVGATLGEGVGVEMLASGLPVSPAAVDATWVVSAPASLVDGLLTGLPTTSAVAMSLS